MTNIKKELKIAIVGSRGIPGNYGGFETFAERLSVALAKKGYKVSVYCPSAYSKINNKYFQGVKRIIIPTIPKKSIDKPLSSLLACCHLTFSDTDICLFLGVSPVLFSFLPRLFGKRLAVNIDGLEWKRKKWGRVASFYLKFSEKLAGIFCHEVVVDSMAIKEYYEKAYKKNANFIAYGTEIVNYQDTNTLAKYGLEKEGYILQVCRLEPENNTHIVIREFERVKTNLKLAIIGDAPYSGEYVKSLKKTKDPRIKFLGAIYGYDYKVLQSNAYCYIHAHEVGGTNPALLEAMGVGNCVIVLDVPFNLEVIGKAGFSFSKKEGDLAYKLQYLIDNPKIVKEYRQKAVKRVKENYNWDSIINQYESLFIRMANKK